MPIHRITKKNFSGSNLRVMEFTRMVIMHGMDNFQNYED